VVTIWPLSSIARRVGIASQPGSIVIASVVLLFPARTLPTNFLFAESLLTLVTAATFAVAYAVAQHATIRNSALLGLLAGLAFLSHGRAVALLAAVGVWMLIVAGSRWRLILAFLASSGVVSLGSWALFTYMTSQLYWNDQRLQNTFDSASTLTPSDFLASVVGYAWYAMAAWPAVAIVGAAIVVKRGRHRHSPELLLALAIATAVVLAIIQITPASNLVAPRLDVWIYGRYLDPLFTVLAVIGVAILARVRDRVIPLVVLVASGAIGVAFLLLTVPRVPVGGFWVDAHVAGMSHLLSEANYLNGVSEPWGLLTVATIAIGTLLAMLGWMRFALPVLAVFALTLSLVTDATRIDTRNEPSRVSEEINEPLTVIPKGQAVAYNVDYGARVNFFAFAANPREIVPISLDGASGTYSAFYTGYADESPAKYGAKRLVASHFYYNTALWIFPGPLLDELDAKGLLQDNTAE